MGPRVDQVSSLLLRRKEYIRRKNQGISNVNERELILSKSYQSVWEVISRLRLRSPKIVIVNLETTSCCSMERSRASSVGMS